MTDDLIIIEGSFAGLSAALQLARAGRKVRIIDAGKPRNRFASHSHGLIGLDGEASTEILQRARSQTLRYPSVRVETGTVCSLARVPDRFLVSVASGAQFSGRRLLIASGVSDVLPKIEGLVAR